MAISKDLPGVSTSIHINGQALPEYHDDDIQDLERTVNYMIEAVPDQIFEIHARASPQASFAGSSLAAHFYVDGQYIDGTLIDAANVTAHGSSTRSRGRHVSSSAVRLYQFASRERQIEIVERTSQSLSSRPRRSGASSVTPPDSYVGFASRPIPSASEIAKSAESAKSDKHPFGLWGPFSGNFRAPPTVGTAVPTSDSAGTVSSLSIASTAVGALSSLAIASAVVGGSSSQSNASTAVRGPTSFPPAAPIDGTIAGAVAQNSDLDELGTIKIVICHVVKKHPVAFGKSSSFTSNISDNTQKAIKDKAGGLLVRFTAPRAVAPVTTWHVDPATGDGNSPVTYIYHYRSREMLDALGVLPKSERIIPLAPRAVKLESVAEEPPPHEQSADELRKLAREAAEVRLHSEGTLKREETEAGDHGRRRCKVDRSIAESFEMVDGDGDWDGVEVEVGSGECELGNRDAVPTVPRSAAGRWN